jgi:DNA-directed RNA polymerase sigma subunit (sigma70/sigma32)
MNEKSHALLEAMRERVRTQLAALTPREAKALRVRFGLDTTDLTTSEEEEALRALAQELAMLKRKP